MSIARTSGGCIASLLLLAGISWTSPSGAAQSAMVSPVLGEAVPAQAAAAATTAMAALSSPRAWMRAAAEALVAAAEAARVATVQAGRIDRIETAALPAARPSPAPAADLLFGAVPVAFGKLPAAARLQPAYDEIAAAAPVPCRTETCRLARTTLNTVVTANRDAGFMKLLDAVNRSVNRLVAYRRDIDTHGVVDLWSRPSETLAAGLGDCEDYAILKMAVLASAGVPMKSMSLVVLKDARRGVYHAVLAVKTTAGSFVLDNLQATVVSDRALPDYRPLYSISDGRGFVYGRPAGAAATVAVSSAEPLTVAPGEGVSVD